MPHVVSLYGMGGTPVPARLSLFGFSGMGQNRGSSAGLHQDEKLIGEVSRYSQMRDIGSTPSINRTPGKVRVLHGDGVRARPQPFGGDFRFDLKLTDKFCFEIGR